MKATALVCLVIAVGVGSPGTAAASANAPFGYPLASGAFAGALTTGPDGNLWFVSRFGVGKMTRQGEVTEYEAPTGNPAIVSGPDGNLWFAGRDAIRRSTTTGVITSFPLPEPKSRPTAITVGPDGNLWFTEGAGSRIGRITPDGNLTEFPLPAGRHPSGIASAPDGNLWFSERGVNRIGRITPAGRVTEFPVPGPLAKLNGIVAGPDGNLWFAEAARPRIGRITPRGRVSQFSVPTAGGTQSIIAGPDGKLWFTAGQEVGAISTAGAVSWPTCLVARCQFPPAALAVGPEGGLWIGTGPGHCPGVCGGQSEIDYQVRPGGIGRYELPQVTLAIGPRAAPVRSGASSVAMACGLADGCRGTLRLGSVEYIDGKRRFRLLAEGRYELGPNQAHRVRVHVLERGLELLRESQGGAVYALALAGPGGHVDAARGPIALKLGGRSPGE